MEKFNIQQKIDNAFVDETNIFKDRFVFYENYEPDVIYHRNKEMEEIIQFFRMIKEGGTGNLDISGPTGTGKTLIIQRVQKEFSKRIGTDKGKLKVVYVNCSDADTKAKVIKKIAFELSDTLNIGWGVDGQLKTIDSILEKLYNVLIILDEVDKVLSKDGDGVLYSLTNRGKISLINISNVVTWRTYITDQRVTSRMQPNQILFNAYTQNALFDILKFRSEKGLKEGTYDDAVISSVTSKIAFSSGDMRKALDMMRRAADYAQMTKKNKIDEESVTFIEKRQELDATIDFIKRLPAPKQVVLLTIFDYMEQHRESPTVEDIHEVYNRLVAKSQRFKPLTLDTIRVYVYELSTYELVERIQGKGLGRGKGRSQQKYMLTIDKELFRREIYNMILIK